MPTCALAVATVGGLANAGPPSKDIKAARTAAATPSSERALRQRLAEFKLEGIPLKDAIDALRDASGANFYVKWARLAEAGVNPETPVTLQVHGTTLAKTLQLILDAVETDNVKLGYYVHENVITISISHTQRTDVVTRVYDITDLMYLIPDIEPNTNPAQNSSGGNSRSNSNTTAGGRASR